MLALHLGPAGPRLIDRPPPTPGPGEALVRVRLAGVCATDLELVKGYMGFEGVLGHEFVGEVEAAPDPAWRGRRVVGDINAACGACHSPCCQHAECLIASNGRDFPRLFGLSADGVHSGGEFHDGLAGERGWPVRH
jgi:threonine dehydrogenase-like Zn-dependent dehydrogenase